MLKHNKHTEVLQRRKKTNNWLIQRKISKQISPSAIAPKFNVKSTTHESNPPSKIPTCGSAINPLTPFRARQNPPDVEEHDFHFQPPSRKKNREREKKRESGNRSRDQSFREKKSFDIVINHVASQLETRWKCWETGRRFSSSGDDDRRWEEREGAISTALHPLQPFHSVPPLPRFRFTS